MMTSIQIAAASDYVRSLTNRAGSILNEGDAAGGNFFVLLGRIINVLLSISGVILFGFILVAAFYWMTAGGNDDQVAKAKRLIVNASVGLILILLSLSIATLIQTALIDRLTSSNAPTGEQLPEEETP